MILKMFFKSSIGALVRCSKCVQSLEEEGITSYKDAGTVSVFVVFVLL